MIDIDKGVLLIAEPFMKDKNFQRTVVLICEHDEAGSFGMVLNKKRKEFVGNYIEFLEDCTFNIYDGGPVQRDHVHFLHRRPDIIPDGLHLSDEIYWGGDFGIVCTLINEGALLEKDIRFYIGYSGWGENQLEEEMMEKSWLTISASNDIVFEKNTSLIWKNSIEKLGDDFRPLINYPLDPSFN